MFPSTEDENSSVIVTTNKGLLINMKPIIEKMKEEASNRKQICVIWSEIKLNSIHPNRYDH